MPLNKPSELRMLTIIVRSVFEKDNKFYPQAFLDECLYELWTMIQLDRIDDSNGIYLDNTDKSKGWKICHYNYFDDGFKSDSKICNRCKWRIKSFGNFAIIHVNDFCYRFFMFDMTEEYVTELIKDFESDDETTL